MDLTQLVRDCIDDMVPVIEAAQCELHTQFVQPLVGSWDGMRLKQIVWNLLSNAVKYAPGSRIEVRTAATPSTATLVVSDTGPGIDPEEQAQLFSQFERARTASHHTGFGFGLWLVRIKLVCLWFSE